jgi:hypothetical protein
MTLPKVGDGYQVGDGNLNEELDVGRGAQAIAVGGASAAVKVGATGGSVGFYGTTPVSLRANSAQATSIVGTASATAVDTNLKAAIIEIMNTLSAVGLWKGGA